MQFDLSGLEGDELEAGRLLSTNARALRSYSDEYSSAVVLFQEGPGLHRDYGQSWIMLSAKSAVVSVYNFSMALKGVRTQARRIRALSDAVGVIERARETLKAEFPDLGELRQTVLHEGEKTWTAERSRENSARGPVRVGGFFSGGGANFSRCIENQSYVASFAGRPVKFEMSNEKAWALIHLIEEIEGALTKPREQAGADSR